MLAQRRVVSVAMPGRRSRKSRAVAVFDGELPIYECVVVDVNTQRDFLTVGGVLPIRHRQATLERIKQLSDWAKKYRLPVVSLVDAHRPGGENVRSPLFHCIEGTAGQQKLSFTLLPKRYLIDHDCSPSLPDNLLETYRQVILHKRTNDVFTNPRADRFFSWLQTKRLVIFGVGAERAIKALVLGLLSRAKSSIVVRDACGYWDDEAGELALRQMEAKGAAMIATDVLVSTDPKDLPVPHIEIKTESE